MKDFGGHTIKIVFDGEDWMAVFVKLPQISAFGSTPEEALDELRIAWDEYVTSCQRHGDAVPINDEEE